MIHIEPYSDSVAKTLLPFIQRFFAVHHSTLSPQDCQDTLNEWTCDRCSLYVITKNGEAVGFVRTHFTSPTVSWIDDLYVDEPYRGQGIGSKAIQKTEDELRACGCQSLCMEVVPDNLSAMRMYHRLGYNRLSLITMRKDFEDFETERIETIAGLPLRVRHFD